MEFEREPVEAVTFPQEALPAAGPTIEVDGELLEVWDAKELRQLHDGPDGRYGNKKRLAAEYGVSHHTIRTLLVGQNPYKRVWFRQRVVELWLESQLWQGEGREEVRIPGLSQVEFIESWNGQPVGERVGTMNAWRKDGIRAPLSRLLANETLPAFLQSSRPGLPAIWPERIIRRVVAAYEAVQAAELPGGVSADPKTGEEFATIGGWIDEERVPFGRLALESALEEIGAFSVSRTRNTQEFDAYSWHTIDAALIDRRNSERMSHELFPDLTSPRVIGTARAWANFLGFRDAEHVKESLKHLPPVSNRGIGKGHRAKFRSHTDIIEVFRERMDDEPGIQARVPGKVIIPGDLDRFISLRPEQHDAAARRLGRPLASMRVRNATNHIVTYYSEREYCLARGLTQRSVSAAEREAARPELNPYAEPLKRLEPLIQEATLLYELPPVELTEDGHVAIDGLLFAPRSVVRAGERPVGKNGARPTQPSPTQVMRRYVRWAGRWAKPILMPLFLVGTAEPRWQQQGIRMLTDGEMTDVVSYLEAESGLSEMLPSGRSLSPLPKLSERGLAVAHDGESLKSEAAWVASSGGKLTFRHFELLRQHHRPVLTITAGGHKVPSWRTRHVQELLRGVRVLEEWRALRANRAQR